MSTIQEGILVTKPSWVFYEDAKRLLERSKSLCEEEKQAQRFIEEAHTFARSAFLMFIFSVEALANEILNSDFRVVPDDQIPENIINKFRIDKRKGVSWCSVTDKVVILPYLCCTPVDWSKKFFDRGAREFQIFDELVDIRDNFVHAKPERRKIEIELSPSRVHKMIDDFPENFWPTTKITKDIDLGADHVEIAKKSVEWIRFQLDTFLEGCLSKDNWWRTEKIVGLATVKRG